eukprot:1189411-Prorocentrum_minimum.AAC.1
MAQSEKRYNTELSLKSIGGKALLTRAGHTEERDELIEFLRDDLLKWMTLEEAVAKLQELVQEFRRNPKQNRLRKIVPNMCELHSDLLVVEAYQWYDDIFRLSTRRHVRPSFADLRHVLNFASMAGCVPQVRALAVLFALSSLLWICGIVTLAYGNITSFYGSSCANNGKDALNTPKTLPLFSTRVEFPTSLPFGPSSITRKSVCLAVLHRLYTSRSSSLVLFSPADVA